MSRFHGKVEKQAQLPFRRAFEIAWKNIRVRLLRSLLVTSGIILALAFLTYILCADALFQNIKANGPPELIRRLKKEGVIQKPEQEAGKAADIRAEAEERTQTWWLVGLALMVSFVGILNAMLLSVTERFAEIGTMKCLGALDFLIVELFLLESTLQGFVGTAIGVVIGLVLALLEAANTYGSESWGLIPYGPLARLVGICLLAGTALTVVGALYPAWRAARMQPVDAMRSEV
jgi:predicted lysophospholipase L1 biosynthesis ABC-type transport system permease subunit